MDKKSEPDPKEKDNLKGLKININEFGQLETSLSIEKVNKFLDKNVEDKKLMQKDEEE